MKETFQKAQKFLVSFNHLQSSKGAGLKIFPHYKIFTLNIKQPLQKYLSKSKGKVLMSSFSVPGLKLGVKPIQQRTLKQRTMKR